MSSKQSLDQTKQTKQKTLNNDKAQKQSHKKKSFKSSQSNRLGGLIYHPNLIPQHKQMLQNRMQRVSLVRNFVQYGGCAMLILHLLNNKFKLSRSTGLFIAIPPILSYLIKVIGYLYVDNYAQTSGLYKVYKISTFD